MKPITISILALFALVPGPQALANSKDVNNMAFKKLFKDIQSDISQNPDPENADIKAFSPEALSSYRARLKEDPTPKSLKKAYQKAARSKPARKAGDKGLSAQNITISDQASCTAAGFLWSQQGSYQYCWITKNWTSATEAMYTIENVILVAIGTVKLTASSEIINNSKIYILGDFFIYPGSTLTNTANSLVYATKKTYGTRTYTGRIGDFGTLENQGTLVNASMIYAKKSTLNNAENATLYNINGGNLITDNTVLGNTGTLKNYAYMYSYKTSLPDIGGTVINNGIMALMNGSSVTVDYNGRIQNTLYGKFLNNYFLYADNSSTIDTSYNGSFISATKATINNAGQFIVNHTFENDGTFNNGNKGNLVANGRSWSSAEPEVYGVITNNGTINNEAGGNTSVNFMGSLGNLSEFHNAGTLSIQTGGMGNATAGTLDNVSGGSINIVSGSISNKGTFNNSGGDTTLSTGGKLYNTGNITNRSGGHITNNGQITNQSGGTLTNQDAYLTSTNLLKNDSGATLNYSYAPPGDFSFSNSGTMTNAGTLNSVTNGYALNNSGNLTNSGTYADTSAGGNYTDLLNTGTFTNSGTVKDIEIGDNGMLNNQSSGTITNNVGWGFDIGQDGTVNNAGTITINSGGSLYLYDNNHVPTKGATLNNTGTIIISANAILDNAVFSHVNNERGGVIKNTGLIRNDTNQYTFVNEGIINNPSGLIAYCSQGGYVGGTVTGKQPEKYGHCQNMPWSYPSSKAETTQKSSSH